MVALIILTVILALWFAALGAAKVAGVPPMRERAAHLGFGVTAYRVIGALELIGVVGLLVGLGVTAVGVAAGVGLLLLLAGAVLTHLRNGDRLPDVAPAVVSVLVVAAYVAVLVGVRR